MILAVEPIWQHVLRGRKLQDVVATLYYGAGVITGICCGLASLIVAAVRNASPPCQDDPDQHDDGTGKFRVLADEAAAPVPELYELMATATSGESMASPATAAGDISSEYNTPLTPLSVPTSKHVSASGSPAALSTPIAGFGTAAGEEDGVDGVDQDATTALGSLLPVSTPGDSAFEADSEAGHVSPLDTLMAQHTAAAAVVDDAGVMQSDAMSDVSTSSLVSEVSAMSEGAVKVNVIKTGSKGSKKSAAKNAVNV